MISHPPFENIEILAKNYPKAIETYIALWKRKSDSGLIKIHKKEIPDEMLISLKTFNHNLLNLVKFNLATKNDRNGYILIHLKD